MTESEILENEEVMPGKDQMAIVFSVNNEKTDEKSGCCGENRCDECCCDEA